MRVRLVLGEILPVLGTIGLLGLWLYQQTGIERRSGELQKLANARAVYRTYQSNNALFNAILELPSKSKGSPRTIRVLQITNYEYGLQAIEAALPEGERSGIPASALGAEPIEDEIQNVQERLEKLQQKLDEKESTIRESATNAKKNHARLYVIISVMMILGALCKLFDKLSTPPPSKAQSV